MSLPALLSSEGLHDAYVLAVFATVYLGMILGGLPRLHLDRTGVALLGAIAIVGAEVMTPEDAARAIHLPTILLLFSFMVISAQMRLGGFYGAVTRRIASPCAQDANAGSSMPVGTASLANRRQAASRRIRPGSMCCQRGGPA